VQGRSFQVLLLVIPHAASGEVASNVLRGNLLPVATWFDDKDLPALNRGQRIRSFDSAAKADLCGHKQ
jgi:hypothetical protein